jgi:hypothetical protein
MFNLDLSSKRAKLALRFFTYGVMTVASAVLTAFLVFVALGYRLDKDFNFSQGGLVQFRSTPDNAAITIDGKTQSIHTPDKMNLNAGQHTFTMSLNGYHTWTKTTDLAPGQLLWLNYARLIPNTITTSTLKQYAAVSSTLPSPDRHWLLMQMKSDEPSYALVDYSDEKKPQYTEFQLPDGLFTKKDGKYGTFHLVEWDLQSKYVLIEHDNGDTTEFARVDRSKPADAVNLTKLFSLNIKKAHFSGSNASTIFAKTDDVLRKLDVNGPTASAALVTGLQDFTVYGEDTIAFTQLQEKTTGDQSTQQQIAGIFKGGKITPVRELAAGKQAKIAYSEYDNHSYLAVTEDDGSTVDVIRDATTTGSSKETNVFSKFTIGSSVDHLVFSSSGRMIMAQHGNKFGTYDIETTKTYLKTLDFGSDKTAELKWLDDYYLWSDDGGVLHLFEFDGTNGHDITSVATGYDVMLSANGKQLLSIGKNETTHDLLLQASKLTTEKN